MDVNVSTKEFRDSLKNIGNTILHSVSDVLASSDFISRTIGMNNAYEDIMYIVQALGREPVSLLGKDFAFIYDHVRRNVEQGTTIPGMFYGVDTSSTGNDYFCPKFTFYKDKPTIKFANPYDDPLNLLDRWMPDVKFEKTKRDTTDYHYSESHDNQTNNIEIDNEEGNTGTQSGKYVKSIKSADTCDLIRKTNDNFKHGKYQTLIARFHTDEEESKSLDNPAQTAVSKQHGMSHGRNLLKKNKTTHNGYDNPYCRVWTYHHQYHTMKDAIRPFDDGYNNPDAFESAVMGSSYGEGGFRTTFDKDYQTDGGSVRLSKYGVLNYDNGHVNIAPTAKITDYFGETIGDKNSDAVPIKKCMFSIENLAWKGGNKNIPDNEFDPNGLSAEQKGPFGGRIMWFPPYNLTFSETSTANWNQNEFIGRGEKIYTYTNTERRGSLTFTLLIDHPSILDYWEDRNSNTDGKYSVDDIDSPENKVLRFFAGCDILKAKAQEYQHIEETDLGKDKDGDNDPGADWNQDGFKYMYCFLYFPNNYSGKDDDAEFAINYLMNGIGTQKQIDNGGISSDFDVNINEKFTGADGYGGYEMRAGKGISIVTDVLEEKYTTIESTFFDKTDNEKGQYLTKSNGDRIKAQYGSIVNLFDLAKQVGGKADSLKSASGTSTGGCSKAVTEGDKPWYRKRWYYRVDKETVNQDLHLKDGEQKNYLDTTSNQYNSKGGYKNIPNTLKERVCFKESDDYKLVSFADMFMALKQPNKDVYEGLYDPENVKLVQELKKGETRKVVDVRFYGGASSQQNNANKKVNEQRNDTLATNRMLTFRNWLNNVNFPFKSDGDNKSPGDKAIQGDGVKYDVNDKDAKAWRCACLVVKYNESAKEAAQVQETAENKDTVSFDSKENSLITPPMQPTLYQSNENPIGLDRNLTQPVVDYNISTNSTGMSYTTNKAIDMSKDYSYNGVKNYTNINSKDGAAITEVIALGKTKKPEADVSVEKNDPNEGKNTPIKKGIVGRYDNEGEFFRLLGKEDPFLHNLITDKIKYFDPAFHSISPEGFNARLTFLHQCTRQGPTVGGSDINSLSAYNLAFGRPPVCILRLGDFYYTKVIINSVQINYEQPQWDLNPEGIGVMPMFANITLDFNFIGGSDLSGPIARLQNAVSFNYYANTSVYDNRAEVVEYDKTGKETQYKPFVYPMIETKTPEEQK